MTDSHEKAVKKIHIAVGFHQILLLMVLTSSRGINNWHLEPGNNVLQRHERGVVKMYILFLGSPIDSEFGHIVYMRQLFLRRVLCDFQNSLLCKNQLRCSRFEVRTESEGGVLRVALDGGLRDQPIKTGGCFRRSCQVPF
jgi:hypothetical protein